MLGADPNQQVAVFGFELHLMLSGAVSSIQVTGCRRKAPHGRQAKLPKPSPGGLGRTGELQDEAFC